MTDTITKQTAPPDQLALMNALHEASLNKDAHVVLNAAIHLAVGAITTICKTQGSDFPFAANYLDGTVTDAMRQILIENWNATSRRVAEMTPEELIGGTD